MENQKLCVGDLIQFRFETGGKLQQRVIMICKGKYHAYDLEKYCFCHASGSLEGIVNKYNPFEDFKIIKQSEWSVYTVQKLF